MEPARATEFIGTTKPTSTLEHLTPAGGHNLFVGGIQLTERYSCFMGRVQQAQGDATISAMKPSAEPASTSSYTTHYKRSYTPVDVPVCTPDGTTTKSTSASRSGDTVSVSSADKEGPSGYAKPVPVKPVSYFDAPLYRPLNTVAPYPGGPASVVSITENKTGYEAYASSPYEESVGFGTRLYIPYPPLTNYTLASPIHGARTGSISSRHGGSESTLGSSIPGSTPGSTPNSKFESGTCQYVPSVPPPASPISRNQTKTNNYMPPSCEDEPESTTSSHMNGSRPDSPLSCAPGDSQNASLVPEGTAAVRGSKNTSHQDEPESGMRSPIPGSTRDPTPGDFIPSILPSLKSQPVALDVIAKPELVKRPLSSNLQEDWEFYLRAKIAGRALRSASKLAKSTNANHSGPPQLMGHISSAKWTETHDCIIQHNSATGDNHGPTQEIELEDTPSCFQDLVAHINDL
ncbi:hypothetical protein GGR50DRAFT_699560 [Xylaria sp. CBS 124048]|nr:hypothetical protein GGR50DRAFT_699560 [Xylaria sp. CBS 124048]